MASKFVDDDAALALLGKKQVLERRFALTSIFAFAVCELVTWETVLSLFSQAFENGGPSGAVYGYIIAWLSTMSVYTVISELASLAPIAGGQYYWVYMLAPPRWKRVCSYLIGWLTSLAWIATVATETLLAGTIVQGMLVLDYPASYGAAMYQGTLLTWAVILVGLLINVLLPRWLPRIEVFIMVLHLAGFIAILTTLLATTRPLGSARSVWLTALNEGNWPSQGLSYCVGFLGNVATFVGADASVHMAEEVSNAALNVPRVIMAAMLINGAAGLGMIVTLLYCLGDVRTVLDSKTGFPFIQVFIDSVGNVAGATVMAALVTALTWAASVGIMTTASRMTWSFARDRGLPFSRQLERVNSRTRVPVVAVLTVTVCAMLLTCIYIGSYVAFNDVISLTITGFYGSYFLPAAFLLYHRIRGNVLTASQADELAGVGAGAGADAGAGTSPSSGGGSSSSSDGARDTSNLTTTTTTPEKPQPAHQPPRNPTSGLNPSEANPSSSTSSPSDQVNRANPALASVASARLVWGPWRVPGLLGVLNNAYACAYMIFVLFWSVWPPSTPVSAATMNYSVLVTGGVLLLSAAWYFARGRRDYRGPLVDEGVERVMRRGSVLGVA